MVLHNTQLCHCFRDRVVIFLWLLFSQPILCGLVKSCVPPPAKASAKWVRAIAASLRSPKMKQKIVGAMFSRLFLKQQQKNLRYSVLRMPSVIIYNLWICTPWCFERKLDFVVQKPWVQTFNGRVEFSFGIKSWRNYIIERARTEFHSLVAKLDASKLVNKSLYVALWSNVISMFWMTRQEKGIWLRLSIASHAGVFRGARISSLHLWEGKKFELP